MTLRPAPAAALRAAVPLAVLVPVVLALAAPAGALPGLARPLAAQEGEGPVAQAPDTTPLTLPAHEEVVLANGLTLVVVPDSSAVATTYTLLVPGGSAADAPGREGTAAVLARLMESVGADDPGMELGVTASSDAMALTLVDSTSSPGASARRLGDAIRRVAVTDSAVAEAREARSTLLAQALERVDVVANRTLFRAVYGDHPYGRGETPATLAAVTAAEVRAWRDAYLRPDGGVLAVSGPVRTGDLVSVLEAGLAGWEADAGPPPEPATRPLASGLEPRRVLVHRPGMAQAVIHLGTALPPAGHEDWTALAVLDRALTARPDAPLVTVEPPGAAEGIVAGTATAAQRRRGPGVFQARAAVRAGVAAEVVRGLLAGLADAGEGFLPPAALRPAREELAGSFRAQLSEPRSAAALLAVNRVLDLPDSAMTSYPVRVGRLGPQELREVAARHLDPAGVSVVVLGDATLLRDDLEALESFELVDAGGEPLAADALEALETLPPLDPSVLEPLSLEYRVVVQDQELGTVRRTLEAGPDSLPGTLRFRSRADLGGQEVTQSVLFTSPGFRALAASSSVTAGGQSGGMSVTVRDGRVTGTLTAGPGASRSLDAPMPEGALIGDMLEVAGWLAASQLDAPEEGGTPATAWRIEVVAPESGAVNTVLLRLGGVEEVTVPAGTFRARRVELGGARPQTLWVSVDEPRVPVRIVPAGRPARIDLAAIERPGG